MILARRHGRYRQRRHALLLLMVLACGYAWYGVAGTVPLVIWWWQCRPRAGGPPWQVDLERVRSASFGPWRVRMRVHGAAPLEIFHDEVAAADLARLRRALKLQLST